MPEPGRLVLSVIIPVFNGEETLAACLDAITAQRGFELGRDYEVIVVDDGSRDASAAIAERYPVRLIRLERNRGRIVARETGARAARSERLLFIDCRVIAAPDLLASYQRLGLEICYAGDYGDEEGARESLVDRLYLALRRLYYRPHYPQREPVITLGAENFFAVPKGSAALFIDRETFLAALPERKDATVNDDARLFERIVLGQGRPIHRVRALRVRYLQRRSLAAQARWLIGRGVLFADYLLVRRARYLGAYLLSLALLAGLVALAWSEPALAVALLAGAALLYLVAVAWITRSLRDLLPFAGLLLVMAALFWWGVTRGLARRVVGRGAARRRR